jgi:hypothetical protein
MAQFKAELIGKGIDPEKYMSDLKKQQQMEAV